MPEVVDEKIVGPQCLAQYGGSPGPGFSHVDGNSTHQAGTNFPGGNCKKLAVYSCHQACS
jgi:hypothetical protein